MNQGQQDVDAIVAHIYETHQLISTFIVPFRGTRCLVVEIVTDIELSRSGASYR
jgi:hypothetical protein